MSDIDELVKRLREHPENDRPGGAVCQDAADVLERQQRDLKEAVELLRNITALMRGECPRLLNEDSGGDGRLSCGIDAFLARVKK
jgi:hypothetical protein